MFYIKRETVFQLLYGFLCQCTLLSPGMSIAYSSVTLSALQGNATTDIKLSKDEAALFVSLMSILQILGAIFSIVTMKRGRRFALVCGDAVAFFGWFLMATSYNIPQLFLGRIIIGIGTGMNSITGVVYLGEIATTNLIPFVTTANSNMLTVGILVIYILGLFYQDNWRGITIIATIPSLIIGGLNYFLLPESPRWLLLKDRKEDARNCLLKLRGLKEETAQFQTEFAEMVQYNESQRTENMQKNEDQDNQEAKGNTIVRKMKIKNILVALKLPVVWKSFLIMNLFFIFQQFSGIYVVISYSVDFVTNAGITVDPYLTSIGMGLIELVAGAVLMFYSTRFNRRSISIISSVGMSISLAALTIYKQFFIHTQISAIPLTCVIIFVATASFGIHILPWAMVGELYPTRYVSVLGPLTSCAAAFYNFISLQIYPYMTAYDNTATIFFYCLVSVASTIFVALALPETHGRTKAEIEEELVKKWLFC